MSAHVAWPAEEDAPAEAGSGYCYCYCVVGAEANLSVDSLEPIPSGSRPHILPVGEVRAVVSTVPASEYCAESLRPRFQDTVWLERTVRLHERVVESCLAQSWVVPAKLCTLFDSEESLALALKGREAELVSELAEIRGKHEWGIRLEADLDRLRRRLLGSVPELMSLQAELSHKSGGAAYLLCKKVEERVNRCMEQAMSDAADEVFARLRSVASAAVLLDASGGGRCRSVLNAAFLVAEGGHARFFEEVTSLLSEMPWLTCEPSGPWPPYNFV